MYINSKFQETLRIFLVDVPTAKGSLNLSNCSSGVIFALTLS